MAKAKEFTYEVTNTIGKLGEDSKYELRVVSWNGNPAKVDLRQWYQKDGQEMCGKGISLTNEEAKTLIDLLTEYMDDDEEGDI